MPSPWDKPSSSACTVPAETLEEIKRLEAFLCKGGPTLEGLVEEVRALRAEVAELRAQQPLRSDVLVLPPFQVRCDRGACVCLGGYDEPRGQSAQLTGRADPGG